MIQESMIAFCTKGSPASFDREHGRQGPDDRQEADGLGDPGQNGGDHDRRALIDVRCVEMERHGRDPEAKPRHHEHHRDQAELGLGHVRQLVEQEPQRLEVADPRRSVQERQPVEEQGRREDAEEEILGRGFLRRPIAAREIKQQVRRDAHQLEPHEQEHQLVGRGDQHRPRVDHEQGAEELTRPVVGRLVDAPAPSTTSPVSKSTIRA